jgi:transcriptional regulator with XRE-family HTH domain
MGESVGSRIKARRVGLGKSMRGVAAKVGVSHQQWRKWERDESRIADPHLAMICRVLEVSADALLGLKADPPLADVSALDDQARKLMANFRALSEPARRELLRASRVMALEERPLPA